MVEIIDTNLPEDFEEIENREQDPNPAPDTHIPGVQL